MEIIASKNLGALRVAKGGDKVYKDECVYCYDTPESEGGLYVSLTSFLGLCKNHLELHWNKTKESLFLHIKLKLKPSLPVPEETKSSEEEVKKPTRLAIGVEGGFDGCVQKKEWDQVLSLAAMPEWTSVSLPADHAPPQVQTSVKGILDATTASKQENIAAWDGEKRVESKLAVGLVQLDNGVKVPPSGWKCAHCDLTSNLWMNLTDGTIVCGRKYFDGSGGNNHAVEHYERTRYSLAVKLGTITPDGADVYSYPEDDMVLDPLLNLHLAHFGINIAEMTKTDSTMTELEIDMNMRIGEWSIIQESGKQLQPCYGPGNTGMANLGNSCYLNSVMQVVFTLPEFQRRYGDLTELVFREGPNNPTGDFESQMCKLAQGLLSGKYSQVPPDSVAPPTASSGDQSGKTPLEPEGISPGMFKALIGKGHPEFSTMRQQDAQEYFLHLLGTIDKQQRVSSPGNGNPADVFRFQLEDRIQCSSSGNVQYSHRDDFILQLPVPMEAATNKEEVRQWEEKKKTLVANKQRVNPDDVVRAKVPFASCLECFRCPQAVEDFYSTAVGGKTTANKTVRFKTFPDYLMVQMTKFSFADDWVPKKYDVLIDVPDKLDLSTLKGCGLQPGEEELPAAPAGGVAEEEKEVELDEGVVMQLVSMGFDMEGCRRAVYHTNNQGVEPAMNWVLEHMGDPDFSTPFVPPSKKPKTSSGSKQAEPPEDAVAMVTSMGFTRDQAIKALKATGNSVERAIDWVFSHAEELDSMETEDAGPSQQYRDGPANYELLAFVSHMGTSTMCGHYVCHIKKDGRWIIFNDSKVAISELPPRDLGYLYLFRRAAT